MTLLKRISTPLDDDDDAKVAAKRPRTDKATTNPKRRVISRHVKRFDGFWEPYDLICEARRCVNVKRALPLFLSDTFSPTILGLCSDYCVSGNLNVHWRLRIDEFGDASIVPLFNAEV